MADPLSIRGRSIEHCRRNLLYPRMRMDVRVVELINIRGRIYKTILYNINSVFMIFPQIG